MRLASLPMPAHSEPAKAKATVDQAWLLPPSLLVVMVMCVVDFTVDAVVVDAVA